MCTSVSVSNLTKVYRHYHGPRALLKGLVLGRPPQTVIRALEDVSFEIRQGEAFGVVGDNGAGKSTLLKVLTGTALPSQGAVSVDGNVAALLELGVGFHPEFTGRENIYFTGAVMGLAREEIRDREGEIVAFSELAEFIDEPVKTYSSGMYVRLGFAVATGFDFSVLIIDEALAVGDQRFQKKCTDRILGFKKEGKTILFCSHNLYQVRTLCGRALWLHRGRPMALGPAGEVVEAYTAFTRESDTAAPEAAASGAASPGQVCWVEEVELTDQSGRRCTRFRSGDTLRLRMVGRFTDAFEGVPAVGLSIVRNDGVVVYTTSTSMDGFELQNLTGGRFTATAVFEDCPLLSGSYHFHLYATDQDYLQSYDILENAASFTISDPGPDVGLVRIPHVWSW
ncbi:MAG: ABC transporter ATP-binding protein [Acidobacteriota bacterium]